MDALLHHIFNRYPSLTIITGTIIPRLNALYVQESQKTDFQMRKFGYRHHHYVTDCFVKYSRNGEALPELEYFKRDAIHLNDLGIALFLDLMNFLIDSVSFNRYEGSCVLNTVNGQRLLEWKF